MVEQRRIPLAKVLKDGSGGMFTLWQIVIQIEEVVEQRGHERQRFAVAPIHAIGSLLTLYEQVFERCGVLVEGLSVAVVGRDRCNEGVQCIVLVHPFEQVVKASAKPVGVHGRHAVHDLDRRFVVVCIARCELTQVEGREVARHIV